MGSRHICLSYKLASSHMYLTFLVRDAWDWMQVKVTFGSFVNVIYKPQFATEKDFERKKAAISRKSPWYKFWNFFRGHKPHPEPHFIIKFDVLFYLKNIHEFIPENCEETYSVLWSMGCAVKFTLANEIVWEVVITSWMEFCVSQVPVTWFLSWGCQVHA